MNTAYFERKKQRQHNNYLARKAAGLCAYGVCAANASDGRVLCEEHRNHLYNDKSRKDRSRFVAGLCRVRSCNNPRMLDRVHCEIHEKLRLATLRKKPSPGKQYKNFPIPINFDELKTFGQVTDAVAKRLGICKSSARDLIVMQGVIRAWTGNTANLCARPANAPVPGPGYDTLRDGTRFRVGNETLGDIALRHGISAMAMRDRVARHGIAIAVGNERLIKRSDPGHVELAAIRIGIEIPRAYIWQAAYGREYLETTLLTREEFEFFISFKGVSARRYSVTHGVDIAKMYELYTRTGVNSAFAKLSGYEPLPRLDTLYECRDISQIKSF